MNDNVQAPALPAELSELPTPPLPPPELPVSPALPVDTATPAPPLVPETAFFPEPPTDVLAAIQQPESKPAVDLDSVRTELDMRQATARQVGRARAGDIPFDWDFQQSLLAFMLRDTDFLSRIAADFDAEYISKNVAGINVYGRHLVHLILRHFEQYGEAPGELVNSVLDSAENVNRETIVSIKSLVAELLARSLQNRQFLLDRMQKFLFVQKATIVMHEMTDRAEKQDVDAIRLLSKTLSDYRTDDSAQCMFEWHKCSDFNQLAFVNQDIVQDILIQDQPCMISGLPKTLKTTLLLDLALSIASGTRFLDRFEVWETMPVAVMSYEAGRRVLQDTLRRIAKSKNIDLSKLDNLFISTALPKLDNPKHLPEIRKFLKNTGAKVLELDNIYLTMNGENASVASVIANKLNACKEICDEFGCLMLFSHHNKKTVADPYRPMNLEDCTGAAYQEFAGQWLMLSRQTQYADNGVHPLFMRTGSREDSGNLFYPMITEGRKSDDGGRHYKVIWQSMEELRDQKQHEIKQKRIDSAKDKIIAFLRKAENHEDTRKGISEATGLQGKLLNSATHELCESGTCTKVDIYRAANKQTYEGVRLIRVPQ